MILTAADQSTLWHTAAMAHLCHTFELRAGGIHGKKLNWKHNVPEHTATMYALCNQEATEPMAIWNSKSLIWPTSLDKPP